MRNKISFFGIFAILAIMTISILGCVPEEADNTGTLEQLDRESANEIEESAAPRMASEKDRFIAFTVEIMCKQMAGESEDLVTEEEANIIAEKHGFESADELEILANDYRNSVTKEEMSLVMQEECPELLESITPVIS
ncbi:MAG: hypothetical protein ACOCUR_02110 [Nanoarchaeota archaeon]